ncbi:MAG: DNA photolyase [gamma proteobacterium symbiont of Phacoides pectinatus]
MPASDDYRDKFRRISGQTLYPRLSVADQRALERIAHHLRLTLQELRQLAEMARDLEMWGEPGLAALLPQTPARLAVPREEKQHLLRELAGHWEALRDEPNRYPMETRQPPPERPGITLREKGRLGLGHCPVASPRTRCCNLLTLDAVDNCGYGCSYCSIQAFSDGHKVFFDPGFSDKLSRLELDPNRLYHIGTGQSSDSLMWGNSRGVLDAQLEFARKHPYVILEFKTKSANVAHLLKQPLPPNILFTWSLNTPGVIADEEHGSAPLAKRLEAAERMAASGAVIGFHFHPMIHYRNWREEYAQVFEQLQSRFDPRQVAMVSFGTLTFIKPVIRRIRQMGIASQILKMPMEDAEGKLSYPTPIKQALFSHAYGSFSSAWKREVFFYLCMENHNLWRPVFGLEYESNEAFEQAMKRHYTNKIEQARRGAGTDGTKKAQ